MNRRTEVMQIAGSLLVALAIAAIAIWAVTEHFGPTSVAKLEAREDRIDARLDAREDLRKDREDAREEREESSGPG
jgi:F0F1-type ATP synthase membrane subunit b/b'